MKFFGIIILASLFPFYQLNAEKNDHKFVLGIDLMGTSRSYNSYSLQDFQARVRYGFLISSESEIGLGAVVDLARQKESSVKSQDLKYFITFKKENKSIR